MTRTAALLIESSRAYGRGLLRGIARHRRGELAACREAGIDVSDEIAVIGVDNDDVVCDLSNPPMSRVIPARNASVSRPPRCSTAGSVRRRARSGGG